MNAMTYKYTDFVHLRKKLTKQSIIFYKVTLQNSYIGLYQSYIILESKID